MKRNCRHISWAVLVFYSQQFILFYPLTKQARAQFSEFLSLQNAFRMVCLQHEKPGKIGLMMFDSRKLWTLINKCVCVCVLSL